MELRRSTAAAALLPLLAMPAAPAAPGTAGDLLAQAQRLAPPEIIDGRIGGAPPLAPLMDATSTELREVIERFTSDRAGLLRRFEVEYSPARRERFREFFSSWRSRLRELDFDALGQEGRIDFLLLDNRLRYELELLDREDRLLAEMLPLVPFAATIVRLQESRRRMEPVDPPAAARTLAALAERVDSLRKAAEAEASAAEDSGAGRSDGARAASSNAASPGRGPGARAAAANASANAARPGRVTAAAPRTTRVVAFRAAGTLTSLQRTLERWYRHYAGYDPIFTWWVSDPYRKADEALEAYVKVVRERLVGIREGEPEPIIGDPIGGPAFRADLAYELIPYSPEELIAIAEREFAWCEAEMLKASRELGFGDDWRAALEKVKTLHVEPGKQPDLIRDLAREAVEFIEARDLVTVPPLAKEIWRIEMMTPERQRIAPFFLGGEVIQVSFPTDGMSHEEKMMSMRGNNIHFSRATVHHELIPGHHLQGFMTSRYNPHRQAFSTPFWGEGWALYWEMLLWDSGFPQSPEDRIGMLFWRSHRAARIIFSLGFHLGTMTPQEAVDFLVDRVGHERANAEAEVRRSFGGSYSPLYQAAYMLGGLQFRALHQELVGSGRMTNREFHDAILQGGRMPVEMVRARLTGQPLTRDHSPAWRFAGDPSGVRASQPPR